MKSGRSMSGRVQAPTPPLAPAPAARQLHPPSATRRLEPPPATRHPPRATRHTPPATRHLPPASANAAAASSGTTALCCYDMLVQKPSTKPMRPVPGQSEPELLHQQCPDAMLLTLQITTNFRRGWLKKALQL